MKICVGDTVTNPFAAHPLDDMLDFAPEPETRTVRAIYVRDWTTEEKGYTKRVEASEDPDAIVYLEDCPTKVRLKTLNKA